MRPSRLVLVIPLVVGSAFAVASTAHAAPPANDDFATPTVIPGLPFGPDLVDTTEATSDDPEDVAAMDACGSPPTFATVWYTVTVAETQWIGLRANSPDYSAGFNVVFDTGAGFACVAGGPDFANVFFLAEAGVQYFVQVIDDQLDGGGNGGTLNFEAISLGVPEPEICPGLAPNDPNIPPGLNRVFGTDGNDVLRGTNGDDLIIGLEGDDEIDGLGGNDIIIGCGGDDTINGGDGDDFIIGDSADFFGNPTSRNGGDDTVSGGPGNDEIRGGPGDDDLTGNSGDDGVFGNQGNDTVNGNHGSDFLGGGFGDDVVNGGHGDDGVTGGPGDDILNGGQGDDFITGDFPNGMPDPMPNSDRCNGGQGDDFILFCEAGNGK